VQAKIDEKGKPLHLGLVSEMAHKTIDQVFAPFFSIPRRMRGIMGFLMAAQMRFIPLDGKQGKRPRIPKDPFFPMALYLLKLRTIANPELLPHYTLWSEASSASHEQPTDPESLSMHRKKRRRRRHRRKGSA
jgi:hypothetical protein